MARKEKPDAVVVEATVNEAAFAQATESLNMLAIANAEANVAAQALATELGYDGSLSVGALEDEIRFYQRRTVEACLELGKRLLLLKEITPHGDFSKRIELLGFADRTARRFMLAAAKTAKSANLAVLSTRVKSANAFLELITEDDDTLESLKELDDIDSMSASQLRTTLRELREDAKAKDERRGELVAQNEKLKEQLVRIKREKPNETLEAARSEAGTILAEVLGRVQGDFRAALQTLHELGRSEVYMAGMVGQVGAALNELRAQFDLPDLSNAQDAALATEVAQWAPQPEQAGA